MAGIFQRACKTALTFTLVSGMFLGSWPTALADNITPKVSEFTLPTGQHLYVKEDHSRPIITIDTWVKTGSVNETPDINGVSHFLEHLLFKGTDKYKPREIDRLLEARGDEFNAATSDDFTHFYITTAPQYFEEALALHSDMMVHAAIPKDELDQERKVVQEEINRANDNPDRQMYIELAKLMYGSHGYGLDTLGPKENIAKIPRENILNYYHYWYQPQNFNTVIVGDVDADKVKQLVEADFPAPKFQRPTDYTPPVVGAVVPPAKPQASVLESPNVSQTYMSLGFLGPAQQNPDDVYALDIAMLALGNGKSSRLYRVLQEQKPIATSVGASNYTQKYSGLVIVDAEAKPDNRATVKNELIRQIQDIKKNGITQAELDKAKTQYLKDFIFENETTDGTASSIGYSVTIGSLQDYLNHVNNVEKVTREKVQDALNRYLDFNKAVLVEMLPSALKANRPAETSQDLNLLQQAAGQSPSGSTTASTVGNTHQTGQTETANQEVQRTVLKNGMVLLSKPIKDSRTVALKIFIKGGQGVESIPGQASLMAAVIPQGTRSRSAEEISREMESKGMSISIGADDDYTEVTGTAISEDLGELFTLMQDLLTHPTFAQSEIDKKKIQMRQGIEASRDNPSSITFENLNLNLYPTHPYGNEGKRVEANLARITRQNLLDYYHRYFQPNNMIVSVVGNYDLPTVTSYLNALFPPVAPAAAKAAALVKVPPVPALAASKVISEPKEQLSAVWLAQGWLVPEIKSEDYVPLKVLNSLIGTGMSSRLFVDLREKQGLAYVVGSMYPSRSQKSRFVIYIGTDPVNTDKVRSGFTDEIKRLQSDLVPETELNEAKSKLIGSFALAHDTNVNQAYYLGLYETLGTGYQYDVRYPKLVDAVTPADIQRVARRYFSGPSIISLVRPAAQPAAKALPAKP